MSWLDRTFMSVFARKAKKQHVDLAHFVVPIVALTMLSAVVGANASKLPDNNQTSAAIIASILSLSIFYAVMEVLWESIRHKQWCRSLLIALLSLYLPFILSPVITQISGNRSLVDGVFYGWWLSFNFMSFVLTSAHESSDATPAESCTDGEKEK